MVMRMGNHSLSMIDVQQLIVRIMQTRIFRAYRFSRSVLEKKKSAEDIGAQE